jgi:DNA polymerase-1
MSPEAVRTELGVKPADVPTYLALSEGSGSSRLTNRQSVRLIELYGDLDAIYKNLAKITSSQIQKKLVENEVQARRYYVESKIERSLEMTPYEIKSSSFNLDTGRNRQLLKTYGFHSLVALLENPAEVRLEWHGSKSSTDSYHAVVDRTAIKELESLIQSSKVCSIDTESDDKDPRKGTLFGVSFSVKPGEAHFVPLIENDLKDVSKDDVLQFLKRIFARDVNFIGHNIKYDYLLLRRNGIRIKSIYFDTMLAAYDCYGDWPFFNLRYLSQKLLGKEIKSYSDLVDQDNTFLDLPFKVMVDHACQDADMTMHLYPVLVNQLKERGITGQYYNDTMSLLKCLCDLEFEGVPVNERKIDKTRGSLIERAVCLKGDVCNELGNAFDLDSQEDLSVILRENLALRRFIRSKTITLSVLEQLAITEPIVRLIVQYKRLRRQIKAVESISSAVTGKRVYPLFKQVRSPAGLVSTTSPSLFDIDALPELRPCFDRGVHGYFTDRQRSLDILADATQDPVLQRAWGSRSKVDRFMTKHPLMKGLDSDELLLYFVLGHSDSSMSRKFLIDHLTVTTIRHDLEKRYQILFQWLESFQREAERNGYAMIDGKRKYIDGLRSSNIAKRRQASAYAVRWLIRY